MSRLPLLFLLAFSAASAALPEPPSQHEPWTPPSVSSYDFPSDLITAAAKLFEAGLADPRGADYRDVEILGFGSKPVSRSTRGWVFGQNRYVVCWDGLVYPALSIGEPANLTEDVRAIAAHEAARDGDPTRLDRDRKGVDFWNKLAGPEPMLPAAIVLLLRLGRPDLAAELWRARPGLDGEDVSWFRESAASWLARAFRRLADARTAEDDLAAAELGESLMVWEARVRERWPGDAGDLKFLAPVASLLEDSRRRLAEPVSGDPDIDTLPLDQQIRTLVGQLDRVHGDKPFMPGPLVLSQGSRYQRVVKIGAPAVGALLDAYELDNRLTRALDYSRPWNRERIPIPVKHVAQSLLIDILKTPGLVERSSIAQLRAWWRLQQATSPAERNLAVLLDDLAGADRWAEAADFLTLRSDIELSGVFPHRMVSNEACQPGKPAPPPHGESLRQREAPAISRVLARRVAQLSVSESSDDHRHACRIAFAAFRWDREAARSPLRFAASQLAVCRADALVTAARLSLGDSQAAADWLSELRNSDGLARADISDWLPLWLFPADPVLRTAADWLFLQPDAPLSPDTQPSLLTSALITLPAYRRAAANALDDYRVKGSVRRNPNGGISYTTKENGSGGGGATPSLDELPEGVERSFRVKDYVAWELCGLEGAPDFELYWPEAQRDEAIHRIAAFLEDNASRFRALPSRIEDVDCLRTKSVYLEKSSIP